MPTGDLSAWHQIVKLRPDLRSGELAQNQFAADLYDVVRGEGPSIYRDPEEFFALTFPTAALRGLVRDVLQRLAGQSEKAVRQLDLTYGGGKTHTLITLYHLVRDPQALPRRLDAVQEFISGSGIEPPRACVAVLPFDKIDTEIGIEAIAPDGEKRQLREPWSILAYQIAGDDGLRLLNGGASAAERQTVPAEPIFVDLFRLPARKELATLILIDEVLMYARDKVRADAAWLGVLESFFQVITQAAVKAGKCAIVASLLATDPGKYDDQGRMVMSALKAIFTRQSEEIVEPVSKTDIAEVLRRRFFTPDSLVNRDAFRAPTLAALNGVFELDDQARRARTDTEKHYLDSYPFHPDLTEIFYARWTQLPNFQRTRGMLRTFALALRDAERWDTAPLISANVFLNAPNSEDLAPAARELADIASRANPEGPSQNWAAILTSEFIKARSIQHEGQRLKQREVEQAVFITFLFSLSADGRANTSNLFTLIGPVKPDKIELEKGLTRWTQISWYLDENEIANAETRSDGTRGLPKTWRLGTRPNLRQMHYEAITRISEAVVLAELERRIRSEKRLTQEAPPGGVHLLPARPADVPDDGELRFVILGPSAASTAGNPSTEARRYLNETTGPDRPRANKNSIILATPSVEGVVSMRDAARAILGWDEVKQLLATQEPDAQRKSMLESFSDEARRLLPRVIQNAYSIIIAYNSKGEVAAFRITPSAEPLFRTVRDTEAARIQEKPVDPGTLLPGGPYDVWRAEESTRWVKDIVGAFATNPKLKKMLNRQAIYETISAGCREGLFVLRQRRPDGSYRTYWREPISLDIVKDVALEAVLPDHAELTSLATDLLQPAQLPDLWHGETLPVAMLIDYFAAAHSIMSGDGETTVIPRATVVAMVEAVRTAVTAGKIWLVFPTASFWHEPLSDILPLHEGTLRLPPEAVPPNKVLPDALPEAWDGATTTARAIWDALASQRGLPLPWEIVRKTLTTANQMHLVEVVPGATPIMSDAAAAPRIQLRLYQNMPPQPPGGGIVIEEPTPQPYGRRTARAQFTIEEIQTLAEEVSALQREAATFGLTIEIAIEVGSAEPPQAESIVAINKILGDIKPGLSLQ